MDIKSIGNFICDMRKENNLTQTELGEMIGVTGKAVSKWEHGASLPDCSILVELSNVLNVTVSELLSGKKREKIEDYEIPINILKDFYIKRYLYRFGILLTLAIIIILTALIITIIMDSGINFKIPSNGINFEIPDSITVFIICIIAQFIYSCKLDKPKGNIRLSLFTFSFKNSWNKNCNNKIYTNSDEFDDRNKKD